MKKIFSNPALRVVRLESDDIIATSGGPILDENGWLSEDDPLYNWEHSGWNNPSNSHFPY